MPLTTVNVLLTPRELDVLKRCITLVIASDPDMDDNPDDQLIGSADVDIALNLYWRLKSIEREEIITH
jgi:hypothetical protein